MKVFKLEGDHLSQLGEIGGPKGDVNEKAIQNLIEKNLSSVFPGLEFLKTEYTIDGFRLDTVAFDTNNNSFAIIEYKNVKQKGAMEQVMGYYNLLQSKKEKFVMLYQRVKKRMLDHEVDTDKSRVIIISPEFTDHQQQAREQLPAIELYEITKYGEGIILFNEVGNKKKPKNPELPNTTGHVGEAKHTHLSAAKIILEEAGKPLHYKEITKRIMDRNLVKITGLKPWNSLRSVISVDMRGSDSAFTAPAKGMIGLKSHQGHAGQGRSAGDWPTAQNPKPSNNQYINAAIIILSESHKPLHYKDLTERAIKKGLIKTSGQTPWDSMASRIYVNMKSNDSVFIKAGKGTFGLKSNPSHMTQRTS